jgi:hypothetical protein
MRQPGTASAGRQRPSIDAALIRQSRRHGGRCPASAGGRQGQQALAAIARANVLAQNRADLAWLHARICSADAGCEPEPVEARFRKLAPDNGVVWLGPLARAQARSDKRVEEQILEVNEPRAAFDLYWTARVAIATARKRMRRRPARPARPPHPLTKALDRQPEALSDAVVPAFKPLSTSCDWNARRMPRPRDVRAHRAGHAAAATRRWSKARHRHGADSATPASPEAVVLDERVATLSYRSQAAGAVVRSQVERDNSRADDRL